MSERELHVYVDALDEPRFAGRLWTRVRNGRESASFQYDAAWLARTDSFALDPELPMHTARINTARALFNAFTDPAPDRWGQMLLRRAERRRAARAHSTPRTLFAADFLVGVHDETRLGALRFRAPGGDAFLTSDGPPVPPLVKLSALLRATDRVLDDTDTDEDLALVLAPGTSLGGARPKASVRDRDGHLAIAKFSKRDDEWPVIPWEATTLALARAAGIAVPEARLETVARRPVLVEQRFDRAGARRVPFMSALTALAATDGEQRSYVELADELRRIGGDVRADLPQLWRRVAFNILVSNTDDHLRNHAFLWAPGGWRLAPAYDLNPTPVDVKAREHALAIDAADPTASIEHALAAAPAFALDAAGARRELAAVARATATWRTVAKAHGLGAAHLDRMASAFEHDDAKAAAKLARR